MGFAVGGEGEDRVAGQQAVGLVKIPRGDLALRNVGVGRGPSGFGEQPKTGAPTQVWGVASFATCTVRPKAILSQTSQISWM